MKILDKITRSGGSNGSHDKLQNEKANDILKGLLKYGLCHPKMNGMDIGILVALKEYSLADVCEAIEAYCIIKSIDRNCQAVEDFLNDVKEYMYK
jgi:hypothetical protein